MILGGLIGFSIGISFGVAQGSAWPAVVWRASVAAFLAGVILRWWGQVWVKSLRQANQERLSAPPKSGSTSATSPARI